MHVARVILLACCLTTTAVSAAPDCAPEPQVLPAALPQRVILVGESHGTEQ